VSNLQSNRFDGIAGKPVEQDPRGVCHEELRVSISSTYRALLSGQLHPVGRESVKANCGPMADQMSFRRPLNARKNIRNSIQPWTLRLFKKNFCGSGTLRIAVNHVVPRQQHEHKVMHPRSLA